MSLVNFLIAKKCKKEFVPIVTWIFNIVVLFEADFTRGFSGLFDYLGVGFLVTNKKIYVFAEFLF